MRYQEPKYIRNNNSALRNKDIINVTTSSDICFFSRPTYTMSGATKIPVSGLTSGSTGVYVVSGDTNITFDFNFTGTTSFSDIDAEFSIEIYEYVKDSLRFKNEPTYQSESYSWSGFSGTSAITETINTSGLTLDNDFLIKSNYKYDVCTEFRGLLGETINTVNNKSGDKYGIYNTLYDYFFIAINEAQIPEFNLTGDKDLLGTFSVYSFEAEDNKTIHPAPNNVNSGFMVALNGTTLAEDYDYTFNSSDSGSTIELVAPTVSGDIITYSYISNNDSTNKVKLDIYDITTTIVSGVTNGEGSENIYFNTDTGKYELYTSITPRNGDSISVILNGTTLANSIDYYQSITNMKRIIVEGVILVGDIVTIYYPVIPDAAGLVDSLEYTIAWGIKDAPKLTNGTFTLELTNDNFTTIIFASGVDYIKNQKNYTTNLVVTGNYGDEFYYRIKNEKNYEAINGDIISSIAYSEIIPITLNTNANNSY